MYNWLNVYRTSNDENSVIRMEQQCRMETQRWDKEIREKLLRKKS